MHAIRYRPAEGSGRPGHRVEHHLGLGARRGVPHRHQRCVQAQEDRPADDRDHRHPERWHQPVPMVDIHIGFCLRHRLCCHPDEISGKGHGHHADQDHQHRQEGRGGPHAETGIMRFGRIIAALWSKEHMRDIAEGIGDREERADRRHRPHQPVRPDPMGMRHLFQHQLLGQEAVEGRNPGHRQRRNRGNGKGDGHEVAQPAKALDVAGMRLVVDNACGHEERGLERGVVDDVKDGHHRRSLGAKAQKHGDEAQMGDRRKGQKRLEIILEEGNLGRHDHGDQPGRGHDPEPLRRACQNRPHARHQE